MNTDIEEIQLVMETLETFDKEFNDFIKVLKEDDLVMITADHGNDPTWAGTDHTREQVPLICFSKSYKKGSYLGERDSFADIGATILENFDLNKEKDMIGKTIKELIA